MTPLIQGDQMRLPLEPIPGFSQVGETHERLDSGPGKRVLRVAEGLGQSEPPETGTKVGFSEAPTWFYSRISYNSYNW